MNENDHIEDVELTETDAAGDAVETAAAGETVDYKALWEEAESRARKLKRKLYTREPSTIKTNDQQDDIAKTVRRLSMIEEKRQYQFENGLSPEETDAVFRFANGTPTKDTLDDPFIRAGIESLRTQKRISDNTPSSSQRSSSFGGKAFAELNEDERRKRYEERMASIRQ